MIDQTIAHYRITAKLGQGGMGEVYRATDTKLDREVAIKILPESFAGDKNRVPRFKREARVLAALNLNTVIDANLRLCLCLVLLGSGSTALADEQVSGVRPGCQAWGIRPWRHIRALRPTT